MILRILFPEGTYGHYISSVIMAASKIVDMPLPVFDKAGSSHDMRDYLKDSSKVQIGHHKKNSWTDENVKTICIAADTDHILDYINNHYTKQNPVDLNKKLIADFGGDFLVEKLKNWNNVEEPWSIRELISFYLLDQIDEWVAQYKDRNGDFTVNANRIVEDFPRLIKEIFSNLNLDFKLPMSEILSNHSNFVQTQQFHNRQKIICKFIESVIHNQVMQLPNNITIFDEAYVQAKLRKKGYEIACYNLNIFPTCASELHKFIIPV